MGGCLKNSIYVFCVLLLTEAMEVAKEEVDAVIEEEITLRLGEDLLQSIEKKFQVDLERSVDMVLVKIKLLLQNGTMHIQDNLIELQDVLDALKTNVGNEQVELCLNEKKNATAALAEKALHQMVVCGYALIGHDPAQAVRKVVALKNMIKMEVKPIYEQKKHIYGLLKVCGHEHDGLKKVVKCVISKSPIIKTAMMAITGKLIEGIVDLTKLMAHGAMHEACLIEVIKTTEDKAFELAKEVKDCAYRQKGPTDINNYLSENNATILDVNKKLNKTVARNETEANMKDTFRKMLAESNIEDLDDRFKDKLVELRQDMDSGNTIISNNVDNVQ